MKEIEKVQRCEIRPFCLEIITKEKTHYFSCDNDTELYAWIEDIYSRSPNGVATPTNFTHNVHVGFDPMTGTFQV
jgi:protein-serine/threonine kinase